MAKTTKRNNVQNMSNYMKAQKAKEAEAKANEGKLVKTNNAYVPNTQKYTAMQAADKVQRVLNGTAKLDDLTDIKEKVIDFNKCERKIKTIQLIYNAGSKVGACTVVAGNMVSFILTEETMDTYKNALKMLKPNKTHEKYTTVWVEGVNKFTFRFKDGFYYEYYVVTNAEMDLLEKKIKAMDKESVTLEELKQLQDDLEPFVRAWQESSIDVSKDKTKVFNKSFEDFFVKVEVTSTFMKNNDDKIFSNLYEMKRLHKAGRKQDMEFRITLPSNPDVMPDLVGFANYKIAETVEAVLNGDLLEMYKGASKGYYEQFANACMEYPELALFISQINNLTYQAHQEDVKISKPQYAKLRNVIYSKAAAYNVPVEDVVKVAVSVAMRFIKESKDKEGKVFIDLGQADIAKFQDTKVSNIFPNEFKVLRTNKPVTQRLNIIAMDQDFEIVEGQEVEFVNGMSVNGAVELDEQFTGVAYNKAGKLVYDVNVYEYEEMKSVLTMETLSAEATKDNKVRDNGEHFAEYLETESKLIVTGRDGNVLVATDKKSILGKIVNSKELMPNNKPVVVTIEDQISFIPDKGKARIFLLIVK